MPEIVGSRLTLLLSNASHRLRLRKRFRARVCHDVEERVTLANSYGERFLAAKPSRVADIRDLEYAAALLYAAKSLDRESLRVADFGGGDGTRAAQVLQMLASTVNVEFQIIEQAGLIEQVRKQQRELLNVDLAICDVEEFKQMDSIGSPYHVVAFVGSATYVHLRTALEVADLSGAPYIWLQRYIISGSETLLLRDSWVANGAEYQEWVPNLATFGLFTSEWEVVWWVTGERLVGSKSRAIGSTHAVNVLLRRRED